MTGSVYGEPYDRLRHKAVFGGRKAIFLSASVPYRRPAADLPTSAARLMNERHVDTSRPARIRDAVLHLCRFAFQRDYGLVFGGHPAISPLVLAAARAADAGRAPRKRVAVFQSYFFGNLVPSETLDLWEHGHLIWTERRATKAESLEVMRAQMLEVDNIVAGVFVGGMDGVLDEAAVFDLKQPTRPQFSVASTGAAAADLLIRDSAKFMDANVTEKVLKEDVCYPVVMRKIFESIDRRVP